MQRVFGLDVFRVYAIVLVVVFHGRDTGMPAWINWFFLRGHVGVELFFVLSAWLVATPLVRGFRNGQIDLVRFWVMRWAKTLPSFWFIFIVVAVLSATSTFGFSPRRFESWWYPLTFRANYLSPEVAAYPAMWSLSVEEQFYVLLPLTLLVLLSAPRWLGLALSGVLLLLPIGVRLAVFWGADLETYDHHLIVTCMDGFVMGTCLVFCREYNLPLWRALQNKSGWYASAGAAIVLLVQLSPARSEVAFGDVPARFITPIGAVLMFPFLSDWRAPHGLVRWLVETLSKGAYAVYLTHDLAIAAVYHLPMTPGWGRFFIMLFVTGVLSWALYRLVELPISNRRERLVQFVRRVLWRWGAVFQR